MKKLTTEHYNFTTTNNWYRIKYRGFSIAIPKEQIPEGMWDPADLAGLTVTINGEEFLVRAVETFAVSRSPEWPYNHYFAILVQ